MYFVCQLLLYLQKIISMTLDDISKEIYRNCLEHNMCSDGKELWKSESYSDLLDMYLREPTFIIKEKPVSNQFIKDNFEKQLLDAKGIYVLEDNISLDLKEKSKDIIINECKGKIDITSPDTILYISDNSSLDININSFGLISMYLFDNSSIKIQSNDKCKIIIFSYENNNIYAP